MASRSDIMSLFTLWIVISTCKSVAFVAANKNSQLPPVVHLSQVFPLLETYDSYADYFNIVQPLLLLDTWESVWLTAFL